ncbi:hypothetical protein [Sphingomonas suaedae]|nr:hypothetical protein [Sphingomonas suaedae]
MDEKAIVRSGGAALGCVAATLLFISVGFMLAFVLAWTGAHCEPQPTCKQSAQFAALRNFAVLLGAATVLGFIVRTLARSVARACGDSPILAATINTVVMLLLVWVSYEGVMFAMLRL